MKFRTVLIILSAAVVIAATYFWGNSNPQPATAEVRALVPQKASGPVVIYKYRVQAIEEAPRQVFFGNFEPKAFTDRYWQDKPQIILFPGKAFPTEAQILPALSPQDTAATVVGIASIERIDKGRKYIFEPISNEPK